MIKDIKILLAQFYIRVMYIIDYILRKINSEALIKIYRS